jgi:hypothetical protein
MYAFDVLSLNAPDPNAPGSVNAAWAGGMSYVDVYMFPCPEVWMER